MPKHPWPNARFATRPLLELAVTFEASPHKPERMAAGVVRLLRDLFGDRAVSMSAADASLPDTIEPLSDLLGPKRALLRCASRDGFTLSASAGRGELNRKALEYDHNRRYRYVPHIPTRLTIELVDIPDEHLSKLQPAIDSFFSLAVASGNCMGGFGRLSEVSRHWTQSWDSPGFVSPVGLVEREIAWRSPGLGTSTIPALDWITLLTPQHLQRLGGRDRFLADASLRIWSPFTRRPLVRPIGASHVLVELGPVLENIYSRDRSLKATGGNLVADDTAAHYLLRRLIGADLLTWQQAPIPRPTPLSSQRRERTEYLRRCRETDASRDPRSGNDAAPADTKERERLWEHLSTNSPECFRQEPVAASAAERRWAAREYGDFATTFVVADHKGRSDLPLWGRFREDDSDLADPILVGAPTFRDCSFVFQSHRHGYNGKQGWNHWPRRKTPDPFHCPRCTHDRFRVLVVFQYSGDEQDPSDPRTLTQPENFFGWIVVRTECASCGWIARVFDLECA